MSRRVRVKVYKIYEFPFCVLDRHNPSADALQKALSNLHLDIKHIVENKFQEVNGNLFKAALTEQNIFVKKNPVVNPQNNHPHNNVGFINENANDHNDNDEDDEPQFENPYIGQTVNIVLESLVNKLQNEYLEQKYGDISFEKKPELYSPSRTITLAGKEYEIPPTLNSNIEKECQMMREKYMDFILHSKIESLI